MNGNLQTNQSHLFEGFDDLSLEKKHSFLAQLQGIPSSFLALQRSYEMPMQKEAVSAWSEYRRDVTKEERNEGKYLLAKTGAGCLILAGGQGSRLGGSVPKGMQPISLVEKKSCLQILLEKVFYIGRQHQSFLPVAIMTSSSNHKEIVKFIEAHNFFGLSQKQVFFFTQKDLPFLSKEGNWFLQNPGELAMGPGGNGESLFLFYQEGLFTHFAKLGVRHLFTIPVDNPLAEPFDVDFLGFHAKSCVDVSLRAVYKKHKEEKVGTLAAHKGKLRIIEYSEKKGRGDFCLANANIFCFSFPFIEQVAKKTIPYHRAEKEGIFGLNKEKKKFWKYEKFLFDVLPFAKNSAVLLSSREDFFSPIKNKEGEDSVITAQKALLTRDQKRYEILQRKKPPREIFELSPLLYYPKEGEEELWRNQPIWERCYIEPSIDVFPCKTDAINCN